MIGDFYPIKPFRRHYHHVENNMVYTYKQDYTAPFISSGLYTLADTSSFSYHHGNDYQLAADYDNRWSISLLRKDINGIYD